MKGRTTTMKTGSGLLGGAKENDLPMKFPACLVMVKEFARAESHMVNRDLFFNRKKLK